MKNMPDQTNEEVKTDAPVEPTGEQTTPPATPESDVAPTEQGEVAPAPLVEKGPFSIIVTWIEGAFPSDMEAAGKFIAEGLQEMNDEPDSVPSCIKSILISRI